ncbi:hypothetical protein E1180_06425 [Roseibium denhamense]|uniref:YARHG domain-containing protein n=1 Tax=Roseibium denhamense TaxID=76305 RepID=A0ABY1NZL5_9HYPH|nr:hypothetical protein [Roseibium denhamense]SMP22410.1 hypothetical protein SAMN06265374_2168 [Roseibium denhamense]
MQVRHIAVAVSVLVFAALSGTAGAQSGRPDTRTMTCDQVRALIQRSGAIVLTTGQNTFDRYAYSRASCFSPQQVLRNDWVQTKDVSKCFVKRCADPQRFPRD